MKLAMWNKKIQSMDKPVVVEFWARWCGPCKVMAPVLDQVKKEYENRVELVKVDADAETTLLQELKIFSIPTVLVYNNGRLIDRKTGAMNISQVRQLFETALQGKKSAAPGKGARVFRVTAAIAVAAGAFFLDHSVPLYILAGLIFFTAVYDRCPVWKFVSGRVRGLLKQS